MEVHEPAFHHFDPFGRLLFRVSQSMAIIGGLVMVAIVAMSMASLLGRKLWASPIVGDVEIVQMLAAPALACFFAFCHLSNGDVRVGIVADQFGPAWSRRFDAFGSLLLGLVAALIAWRTAVGAVALHESGETSALLSWPIWLSQAFVVPGFALQAVAGLYMAVRPFVRYDRSRA